MRVRYRNAEVKMSLDSIDDVIRRLDEIVERAWTARSRAGYFAALYRRVTHAVRDGIQNHRFQNGPLIEKLDMVFASRYLDAVAAFDTGVSPSRSWRVALQGCSSARPLILQQMLAGMNAHINLDLGIAAALTAPGPRLPELKADFDEINVVLAGQVDAVKAEIAQLSPLIGELEKVDARGQAGAINFSMTAARDAAWMSAQRLTLTPPLMVPIAIGGMDMAVSVFGRSILLLDFPLIRAAECEDVRRAIEVLSQTASAAAALT
jgi:hypothetical protein